MDPSEEPRDPIAACFAITELLEAILRHLDTKTLLLSQRVNHKFLNVIQNGDAFKQRLFLLPASPSQINEPDFQPNQSLRPHILIEELGSEGDDRNAKLNLYWYGFDRLRESRCTQPAVLNPLFFDLPRWRMAEQWPAQYRFRSAILDEKKLLPASSPLRGMYLAHPMPLEVRFKYICGSQVEPRSVVVKGREGLRPRTLGEMMDEADEGGPISRGYGWRGVKVQLWGRRLPEPVKVRRVNLRKEMRAEMFERERRAERQRDNEMWERRMLKKARRVDKTVEVPIIRRHEAAIREEVPQGELGEPIEGLWKLFGE